MREYHRLYRQALLQALLFPALALLIDVGTDLLSCNRYNPYLPLCTQTDSPLSQWLEYLQLGCAVLTLPMMCLACGRALRQAASARGEAWTGERAK